MHLVRLQLIPKIVSGGLLLFVLAVHPAWGQRTLEADVYRDKLRGMWFGQLIGNHSGRDFEGKYCTREAAPDELFQWVIKTSYADPWTGDDDTSFEYLYLHTLETYGIDPTYSQIKNEWDLYVPLTGIYIANKQAKYLMNHGFSPPETGSYTNNIHSFAIDSQITTEFFGSLAPGMRQWAIDAARTFGGVTNEGFSLHAAQFYAAIYAAAACESDINALVLAGQQCLPVSSRSYKVIQDVRDWYAQDMLDDIPDWRETRRKIYDHYHGTYAYGRYRYWIESTINLAMTTLTLLYGQGDFEETIKIAVLSGYDADCNPATAGGLIGMINGFTGLPTDLTGPATDHYRVLYRPGLPQYDTISNLAVRMQAVGEQVIVAQGGGIASGTYTLPDESPIITEPEMPDPTTGPTGLVAAAQNAGWNITVSASIERHNPLNDRQNLESIIDGIVDVRYNGRLPYSTYDGVNSQPAGGDFYQINFPQPVRFDALTFYEGDAVGGYNRDPRTEGLNGGYFDTLDVEVRTGQGWVSVQNLMFSEPLDPFKAYQVIDLTFDRLWGIGIRIRGTAGGAHEYTTITELVVHGALVAADFNGDNRVDQTDYAVFRNCATGPGILQTDSLCQEADLDGDGDVDQDDFAIFQRCYSGESRPADPNCAD
ncbi:MAG: ADP-ribosylglycohydrolase family protein [Phycisphaerales bacterium]|nr:ADP-ribosylglycohydrolase family protein [Phycisphaerales bacterium]